MFADTVGLYIFILLFRSIYIVILCVHYERKQLKQQKLNQQLTDKQSDSLAEQYKAKDKEVKRRCATDKQAWYDLKASEAEAAHSFIHSFL